VFDSTASQERAEARVGVRIARWRLERCIDVDVIGDSYLATARADAGSNGDVAQVFVVNAAVGGDKEARLELTRSIGSARPVGHPGAGSFDDADTSPEGVPFFWSALPRGETLAELMARRAHAMPPAEALRIAADALDILARAHANDVVHGAVEPRFVFLTDSGTVRLCGFGLARARRRACALLDLRVPPGAVGFVAPNQVVGEPPNSASDVWSAAALALHAMSGDYTYPGTTDAERQHSATLGRVRHLGQIAPDAPRVLIDLFEQALDNVTEAHQLAVRFRVLSDAREVRLLRHLHDEVPHRRSSRPPPSGRPGATVSIPPAPQWNGPRPKGGYSQMSPAVTPQTANTVPQFEQVDPSRGRPPRR
jgi:serine/threonine protein kinase